MSRALKVDPTSDGRNQSSAVVVRGGGFPCPVGADLDRMRVLIHPPRKPPMRMMRPTLIEDKRFEPAGCLDELQTFVQSAAGAGTPVHEVERGLWRRLLQLGYQLQGQFLMVSL